MPKIALLTGPRRIEVRERPPLEPAPNDVVVAVEAAGICGTDLALFSGEYRVKLPLVPGHEFVGKVTAAGQNVDPRWIGKRVAAEINNTCFACKWEPLCRACRLGLPTHCQRRTVTGIIDRDGAFAEEIAVPAGTLHEIPAALDSRAAVLVEPLAAALQTFNLTPLRGNEAVAVLGAGRLGILIIFAAVLRGLRVVAVSASESKRDRAMDFGAFAACTPGQAEQTIKKETEGLGIDIVVDATGNPEGLELAMRLVRPRGTIALKTTCGLPAREIDATKIAVDEIRVQGSRCGAYPPAIELLVKHQGQLQKLVTRITGLNDAQDALLAARAENKVIFQIACFRENRL
jgi:2-desacetyl-2-hydroxyethyl bacteriochlorophyllide A dehydrogenase